MSAHVARSHGSDDGGEDRPPPHHVHFAGKGKRKPNLGGRAVGRLNTRDKTRNLSLKEITDTKGPVPIQFELRDKQTVMLLDDHAAHWSSYIGEINAGIQQHLQKAYNTNKAAFKAQHWVIDPTTGTYNVEKIRRERLENITASEWDKGRPQSLRSTHRSLTHSSWHTLLTRNSFGMKTDVYTVLPARATASPSTPVHESTPNSLHKKVDFMMSIFKSDSKYSDMFSWFESGGARGSGGCRDEEEGADHQDDEDEDGDGNT
nr:F-box domain, leucine-rich repeat domain, L domain-like protein [Tanacetum cinerariifolium]